MQTYMFIVKGMSTCKYNSCQQLLRVNSYPSHAQLLRVTVHATHAMTASPDLHKCDHRAAGGILIIVTVHIPTRITHALHISDALVSSTWACV